MGCAAVFSSRGFGLWGNCVHPDVKANPCLRPTGRDVSLMATTYG
jgi:hypothetical protein